MKLGIHPFNIHFTLIILLTINIYITLLLNILKILTKSYVIYYNLTTRVKEIFYLHLIIIVVYLFGHILYS